MEILLYGIGTFLIAIIGTVLFIIPGLFLSIALIFVLFIAVYENQGFKESVKESINLIKGNWWSTAGILIVLSIIQGVLAFIFQLPQTILTFYVTLNLIDGVGLDSTQELLLLITSIISAFTLIFYTIVIIGTVFQYFNLVVKKELSREG